MLSTPEKLAQPELRTLVLDILLKAEKPLHSADVLKQLPRPYRVPETNVLSLLTELHQEGLIFRWGLARKRELFATDSPLQSAQRCIPNALREPLSLAQLKVKVGRQIRPTKDIGNVISQALKDLVKQGLVVKHPKLGERYALHETPPSFEEALQRLREQFHDLTPDAIHDAVLRCFAPRQSLSERIQDAIVAAEPRAKQGALASIPQVRSNVNPPVSKEEFDSALLELGRQGMLSIHIFYGHAQVSEQELNELVFDQKETYYGGVTFRNH